MLKKYLQLELNDRQKKALEYLRENQYITNSEYRKINDIGKVITAEELNVMVKQSIIKKIGNGRSTKYILVND